MNDKEKLVILFATTNKNKLSRIRALFKDENYSILDAESVGYDQEPEETANTCIGIATQKALWYLENTPQNIPILTQDDTLRFLDVDKDDQPNLSIKDPVINKYGEFNDELAVRYYTELANKYGGVINMVFEYGHAVALKDKLDATKYKIFSSKSVLMARMVTKPVGLTSVPGYFMSAIMQVKISNDWIYFTELTEDQKILADSDLHRSIEYLFSKIR